MNEDPDFNALLILPRISVQNANAISSSLTWGFPSMTAFIGLMWALERRLVENDPHIAILFKSVGVVCHKFIPKVTQDSFIKGFCLTRNPVDEEGNTLSIVQEGKAHMDITLVFGIEASSSILISNSEMNNMSRHVMDVIASMRIAGGTVIPRQERNPYMEVIPPDFENRILSFLKLRNRLLPGFALVSREDLLKTRLAEMRSETSGATLLDAWIDLSRVNSYAQRNGDTEEDSSVEWISSRQKGGGWIVPIPVGYAALTELFPAGSVSNVRDEKTPVRFVESAYSIGQWIGPHRLSDARDFLWYGHYDETIGLYRCVNNYQSKGVDTNV